MGQKQPDLAEIQKIIPLNLPVQATDFYIHQEEGIDRLVVLAFKLPAQEVERFVSKNALSEFIKAGTRPFTSVELKSLKWWRPDQLKDVRGGSHVDTAWVHEVLIGYENNEVHATVYYKYFTL